MRKMLKKITYLLFAMIFTCGIFSTISASAASSRTVATIGGKSYSSLEAAVKAVKNGQTIKLRKDVKALELNLNRNAEYTINLNGHKLTRQASTVDSLLNIKKGKVTIKNGTIGLSPTVSKNASLTMSAIEMQKKYSPSISVKTKGKLSIKSGTYYEIYNKGTATIKNGTFSSVITNYPTGTMTITGGKYEPPKNWQIITNNGKMTISKGTFKNFQIQNNGTMKINGGTFTGSAKTAYMITNGRSSDSSTMTISGGTFTFENVAARGTYNLIWSAKGVLKITGGTFINLNASNKFTSNVIDNGSKSTFTMTGGTLKASGPKGYDLENYGTAKLKGGSLSSEQSYKIYVAGSNATLSYSNINLTESEIYYSPYSI